MSEKPQAMQLLLRKVARAGDPLALTPLLAHQLARSSDPEAMVTALADWYSELARELKNQPWGEEWPVSRLVCPFQEAAAKRGIPAEEFYPRFLQRLTDQRGFNEEARGGGAATREKILNASLEVFSDKGFHLATVDEIADRAGVGKGTLYRHFKNKEAIFNEVVNVRLAQLEAKAEQVLDGQDDVLTLIGKYMQIYLEFFDQNQRFYRIMVQEQLDLRHRVQELYIEKVMRRVPLLKRKISEARLCHIVKDVNFPTVFYGVMGFLHGVIQKWLANDCAYSLLDELPTVRQVLFYGFVREEVKTEESNRGGP